MASIIDDLIRDATNDTVALTSLLRRVKVAATLLELSSIEAWVENELHGYKSDVPAYRKVSGSPAQWHPYLERWVPISGNTDFMRQCPIRDSIAALEQQLRSGSTSLILEFSGAQGAKIDKLMEVGWGRYGLIIMTSRHAAILDNVRNLVLDWVLALKNSGVVGSEFDFTENEKARAMVVINNSGSMVGAIGVGNSTGNVEIGTLNFELAAKVVADTRQHLPVLVAGGVDEARLRAVLDRADQALAAAKPDQGTIRSVLNDLKSVAINAAGSVVGAGVITMLNQVLGTGVPAP